MLGLHYLGILTDGLTKLHFTVTPSVLIITAGNDFMKSAPDYFVKMRTRNEQCRWLLCVTLGEKIHWDFSAPTLSPLRDWHASSFLLIVKPIVFLFLPCLPGNSELNWSSITTFTHSISRLIFSFVFGINLCVHCKWVFYWKMKNPWSLLRRECKYMQKLSVNNSSGSLWINFILISGNWAL